MSKIVNIIFNHIYNKTVDYYYNVDTRTVDYLFCKSNVIISETEYEIYDHYCSTLQNLRKKYI